MVDVVPSPNPGVSAEELASLHSPDTLETPFGTLEFFDGVPLPSTVEKSYDAVDLVRGPPSLPVPVLFGLRDHLAESPTRPTNRTRRCSPCGSTNDWDTYFAGRAAAVGLVPAEVVDVLFLQLRSR